MSHYQVLLEPFALSPNLKALVERQAASWEQNDFALAAADWHPEGVLVSPGGIWRAHELEAEMNSFHQNFADLKVTIKSAFASRDETRLAVEWDWTVTNRALGERGTTPDAIIAELEGGKILSWREYFDLSGSVEHS